MAKWLTPDGLAKHYSKVKLVHQLMLELGVDVIDLQSHEVVLEALDLEKQMENPLHTCLDFSLEQIKVMEADNVHDDDRSKRAHAFASTIKPVITAEDWAELVYMSDTCQNYITASHELGMESDLAADWVLDQLRPQAVPELPACVEDLVLEKVLAGLT